MTSPQSKDDKQLWEDAPQEFREWLLFHYPINYYQIFGDTYEDLTPELRKLLIKKKNDGLNGTKENLLKEKELLKKK